MYLYIYIFSVVACQRYLYPDVISMTVNVVIFQKFIIKNCFTEPYLCLNALFIMVIVIGIVIVVVIVTTYSLQTEYQGAFVSTFFFINCGLL